MTFGTSITLKRIPLQVSVVATLVALFLASLIPTIVSAALATDPVLVGAGDIAYCSGNNDEATAKLLDTIAGTVFVLGDNVYNNGTAAEFANCYGPTWGRHKARTYPAAGNHEYVTSGAAGYFGYFGARAGDPTKGYYSYDVGAWHVIVLNSGCSFVGGCHAGSPQEQWLRADLAAHPAACTLAYWHHPRFSSGTNGSQAVMQPFWQALYEAGADVVLSGHDHHYERFALQDPTGNADPHGLRQFIVGTGGKAPGPSRPAKPNSEVRDYTTYGVLKLTLHPTSYDWQFVPVAGKTFSDTGTGTCVSPSPTAGNLLRNGSFETDQNPVDSKPDNWSTVTAFTRSNAIPAQAGAFAGKFTDAGNQNFTISQTVPNLTASTRYTLSGWVNIPAQNDSTFVCNLQVRWLDSAGAQVGINTAASFTAPTQGWKGVSTTLLAPTGTTKARVQMVTRSLNGNIYFDNLAFRR